VLDDGEIVCFQQGCDALGNPLGPLFHSLLTVSGGARSGELRWSELDTPNRGWHLPKQRAKNSKAHDISLVPVHKRLKF
jgi:hypothetical protein